MDNLKKLDDIVKTCDMIAEEHFKKVDEALVSLLSSDEPLVWTNLGLMTKSQYNKLIEEGKFKRREINREEKLIEEICKIAGIDDIGDLSDGFHTFNSLYHQRAVLFATIVNQNKSISWKTHKHEDGEPCFGGGWFLVAIDTPEGTYGYHYEDKYWDMFQCEELDKAKPWDGYTDKDVSRLLSLA